MKTIKDRKYLYNVGDVVNGLIITKQCEKIEKNGSSKKAYQYNCPICGYDCGEYYKNGVYHNEHVVTENNLKSGAGCVACSKNGIVVPLINSIHVLRPDMEKLLKNKNDAMKYAPKSDKKLQCLCPDCGREYTRSCAKIANYGVPCVCGDGFSYPEKFIFEALRQLKVKFEPQYYLPNSMFRYDFYVQDCNILIEVHGIQHYEKKWDYRDEVENDIKKKEFAFSRGFTNDNYITLDCRESNLNFIKSSLLNSRLVNHFNMNNIDFCQCAEFATGNLVKYASDLWNNGSSIQEISLQMKMHKHTIISYLKQGNDNKWCNYIPGDGVKRYNQIKKKK